MKQLIDTLRGSLPQGSTLPEAVWRQRHTGIVALLWGHAVAVPVFAVIQGFALWQLTLESSVLPLAAVAASSGPLSRRARTAVASLGLLSASAILVHLSGGVIEMHFHFFVMVTVVALYQDWLPFFAAIGFVLVHHGVASALDERAVFNHPAALSHPWRWAAIHAFFIAGISAVCLVTWRLNETVLARQRAAEERLREETAIIETLHDVGRTVAAELDLHVVIQKVTDATTSLTAAAFGAFFYNAVSEAGESYVLYTLSGAPAEAFASFPLPRNTAIFGPTFAGEGVIRLHDVTSDERYGKNSPYAGMPEGHLPVRSYLAVPVTSRAGEVYGGIFLGHPDAGRFTEAHERLAVGIAGHAAVAIDNARLFESERRARSAVEDARRRLLLVSEAGRVLASTLDVDSTLRDLCALVTPEIADGCVIYLVGAGGRIEQAAVRLAPLEEVAPIEFPSLDPDHAHPVARVVRTAVAEFLPEIPDSLLDEVIEDPRQRELVGRANPTSAIIVPLIGRNATLGALALGTFRASGRRLSERDLEFAEEVARRAGVAIDHARLYAEQRDVAATLQHSLLPDELPVLPGIETAARYLPGGPGVEVGGDWYDVLAFADGRLGLVMGDVVGRGVPAATLMGQLRNALRAYAYDGHRPSVVLDRLNRFVFEIGGPRSMATLAYGIFDPEAGVLTLANAGHPPPLIRHGDGGAIFVECALGPPLGAVRNSTYTDVPVEVPMGATLLFYTDGLVEDRQMSLDDGMKRMRIIAEHGPSEVGPLCDHVIAGGLAGRAAGDDTALLAMRCLPIGRELRMSLPSRPGVLRPLRTALRRWLRAAGASEQETFEILVAAGEACANAVQHAGARSSTFEIHGTLDSEVLIKVRDHGRWRQPRRSMGGRGLSIMEQFMDDVEVSTTDAGTEVVLRRTLCAAEGGGL